MLDRVAQNDTASSIVKNVMILVDRAVSSKIEKI